MGKPKFDPNKPFEVAGEGPKPKFDPNQPFDTLEENRLSLEEPGFLDKVGQGVIKVGKFVDSYTGAPTRAGIGALQEGQNPLSAFMSQFGENPELAPSGKDIAARAGASTESRVTVTPEQKQSFNERFNPGLAAAFKKAGRQYEPTESISPAGAIGLGIDIAADPTNLLPGYAAAKAATKGALGVARGAGELAISATRALPGGGTAVKMAQTAAEAPKAVKQAIEFVFKPTQAADFPKMIEIAKANGIDPALLPESVEFGQNSFVSRASRNLREGPLGQAELEKFEQGHRAVQEAANRKISEIGGGHALNSVEAGATIRQGYNDAVDRLFDDVDFTYNSVINQSPGIRLSPEAQAAIESKLKGVEKYALGLKSRAITNTEMGQADQLLRAVEGVRAGNGSLKQTYEAMSRLGRHAFKKAKNSLADVPVDQKKMQELYFALRDGFVDSTRGYLGDDVADALITNNDKITKFNANTKHISSIIGNDSLADERLFNSLIMNGDSKKIAALQELLSPEQVQALKGAVLENLIKRDPDGAFNFTTLHSAMRNKRNVLESLLSPEELAQYGSLVKLGDRFGNAVLSTSGTGASNLFRNLVEGIGDNTLTRSVISGMKESARGRAQLPPVPLRDIPPSAAPVVPRGDIPPSAAPVVPRGASPRSTALPRRTSPEEVAKYLQVMAAQEGSSEKEKATQRRLETIKRLRGQ